MRRSLGVVTLFVASVVAVPVGPGAAAAAPDLGRRDDRRQRPNAAAEQVANELLVRFDTTGRHATSRVDRAHAVARVGGRITESLEPAVPGLHRVVLAGNVDANQAIAALRSRNDVRYVEPNRLLHAAAVPDDSRFDEQWALHNTGQEIQGVAGTPDADIDAPEAWNVTTGSPDVTVAVLDSGVAYDHPDLAPNMWVNTDEIAGNGVDDDGNGFVDDRRGWDFVSGDNAPTDEQGHGTHVAATIGARGDNDTTGAGTTDVTGVAWNVRLMPIRVLNENGEGSYADLIAGIGYAHRNGAHIANLSLGARFNSDAMRDALAAAGDVTWIVAAGNESSDLEWAEQYPCEFDLPNLVCVAATDQNDELASFSNYGASGVDLAAPGVSTLSASPYSRVWFDDFETPIDRRWVTGGTPDTWARTTSVPAAGATSTWLTDSPDGPYPDGSDNWARTAAVDLTGTRDCVVRFRAVYDVESFFDFLRVEASGGTDGPWTEILQLTGFWPAPDETIEARLPDSLDGAPAAHLRFRLNPDEQYDGDGAYLDDVAIACGGVYAADSFQYLSGTSMATPHVSGVAALIKAAHPDFSTAQVRAKLLASVDRKESLAGKVATGGRINAALAVR